MLVLVSFGLVLLATILLVVGLLTDDGLTLIYLSIGSSFAAAVVLYGAFRRARPSQERPTEAPAPLLPDLADHEPAAPSVVDATGVEPEAEPEPPTAPEATPAPAATAADDWAADDDWATDDDWAEAGDFEVEFPIADYDELSVAEIMPLLPQLYSDELEVVAERERQGKNRATILARLEELAATGTDADAEVVASAGGADATTVLPAAASAAAPAPAPEPAPDRPAPAPRPPVPTPTVPSLSDDEDDELPFPIADYDELTSDQILPLLAQLEDDELEDVKAREAAGQARKSVIVEIDRQLGLVEAGTDAGPADVATPAATPAPAVATPAPEPDVRDEPRREAPDSSVLAISGYDGLTVAQIRPLLAGLSAAELRAVLDHEVARDNRRTVVADIEKRLATLDEAPAASAPAAAPAPSRPARATKKAAKRPAKRAAKKAAANNHRFPIDDYDRLTVSQIRPKLAALSKAQLRQVRDREATGANRKTVLAEIERRLS